jgi:uncharacterized protein YjbI with pentapeptide repeats
MTMANKEHLKLLRQGVKAWNRWREDNPGDQPDLFEAGLSKARLSGVDLSRADLRMADLVKAELVKADLSRAQLSGADLCEAHLREAHLSMADLRRADLRGADLNGAHLSGAMLSGAILGGARLLGANLSRAVLSGAVLSRATLLLATLSRADLRGADLSGAIVGNTSFDDLDLSEAKGLDAVDHRLPSTVGVDTLDKSHGQIPEVFLRGCGLSDWEIEAARLYQPDLGRDKIGDIVYKIHDLRAQQAIQVNSLFISYSRADGPFVDCLENTLTQKGIRFWRDVHDATAGRLEKQIDRAMRLNPTVLLVLSAASVQSDWVEYEARLARELEKELGRDVLCPVALDDSWKTCRWPERLREQIMEYNILDFSAWQDEAFFRRTAARLIDGLDLFYKGE